MLWTPPPNTTHHAPRPPPLPARTQEKMTTSSCLPWKESTVSIITCRRWGGGAGGRCRLLAALVQTRTLCHWSEL